MSTVNANFSINNLPQLDRYHNETLKAPVVEQVQKEQKHLNETIRNLKRPNEIKNSNLVENDKKNIQRASKKQQHRKHNSHSKKREKKKDNSDENGFFIDVEC
jgi:hypothetical protein